MGRIEGRQQRAQRGKLSMNRGVGETGSFKVLGIWGMPISRADKGRGAFHKDLGEEKSIVVG